MPSLGLGQAAVLSVTLLMGASQTVRSRYLEQHSAREARDLERVFALMATVAQSVLAAASEEELEANIESELFSGAFADLLRHSATAPSASRADIDEWSKDNWRHFLEAAERSGLPTSKVDRALELTAFSSKLHRAFAAVYKADDARAIEPHEFFYDIEIPANLREAAYASFESIICMITIVYAVEHHVSVSRWQIDALVDRWESGQSDSLPVLITIATDAGVMSDELWVHRDQLIERGVYEDSPRPELTHEGADTFAEDLRTIAEHANRQADGVWPHKLPSQ